MTLQTMWGGFMWPGLTNIRNSNRFNISTAAATNSGDSVAFTFQAPATGSITGASVWVTVNASGFELRLETTNGTGANSGKPTGTLANGSDSNVAVASGTGVKTVTFDGATSVTKGDYLGLVILQSAGAVTASVMNNVNVPNSGPSKLWTGAAGTPITYTQSTTLLPNMAINYGDTYHWIPGSYPVSHTTSNNTGGIGNGAERGIQFQLPFPARARGWYVNVGLNGGASADFDVILYDDTGAPNYTALKTASVLGGQPLTIGYPQMIQGLFPSTYDLAANTVYSLVVQQKSANAVNYNELTMMDTGVAAMRGCFPGGTNLSGILRANTSSSWTLSSTQFSAFMGLLFDGFDDAAGGAAATVAIPIGGRLAQV